MDTRKLVRSLTVNQGQILGPLIDQYLARAKFPPKWELIIENEKEWDPHFHPSSDSFTDLDTLYLDKTNQLKRSPISASLRKTFDVGHMWHRYLQNILIEMKLVDPENVEHPLHPRLFEIKGQWFYGRGTADLVDVNIPGHGSWLVDIKTMNKENFQSPREEVLKKYFAQVNLYGDWLETPKMMILAVCKDSPHDFREWIVPRDKETLDFIYDRWSTVSASIIRGVMPSEELS
jgi:hypothetical protein